jgi:hypothetical protein
MATRAAYRKNEFAGVIAVILELPRGNEHPK